MAVRRQDEQASAADRPNPKQDLEDYRETREPGEAPGPRNQPRDGLAGR